MKKQTIIYIGFGVLFTVTTLILLISNRKKKKLIMQKEEELNRLEDHNALMNKLEKTIVDWNIREKEVKKEETKQDAAKS